MFLQLEAFINKLIFFRNMYFNPRPGRSLQRTEQVIKVKTRLHFSCNRAKKHQILRRKLAAATRRRAILIPLQELSLYKRTLRKYYNYIFLINNQVDVVIFNYLFNIYNLNLQIGNNDVYNLK